MSQRLCTVDGDQVRDDWKAARRIVVAHLRATGTVPNEGLHAMSREALDALEAYHQASRALRDATPWTSDWVRLRMVVQTLREEYEAVIAADERASQTSEARFVVPITREER